MAIRVGHDNSTERVYEHYVGGDDKTLAFPVFIFAAQTKEIFFNGLKNLEQRGHKCMELREIYVNIFFFNPVACCFLYTAKDLSAPVVFVYIGI
jgi:hypothetical protein